LGFPSNSSLPQLGYKAVTDILLELTGIQKSFGQIHALQNASLQVRPGTVHALLGENGAGKTTLMRVAFGMVRADSGSITLHGRPCKFSSPNDALSAGIGMVHQHFTLVPAMTVGENLLLGGRGRFNRDTGNRLTERLTARTGFPLKAKARVEELSVGEQQRVEIAKAVAREPSVLILDEPTAVLAPAEIDDLLDWLRRFVAGGNSAVLITHKLHEALKVADDITVMRVGIVVQTVKAAETSADSLTAAMLGASIRAVQPMTQSDGGAVILAGNDLGLERDGRQFLRGASLEVRSGEIVGIAAIEGSGQHELLRLLAGRMTPDRGTLTRPGEVGFVPEDRHRDAVLLDRSLTENVALRGAGARSGTLRWTSFQSSTRDLMKRFDVRAPDSETPMRSLSGGNQQKLVLARELSHERPGKPRAIVADNPTRGLDVRATGAIHTYLREAADSGAAVVVYSSDIDELLSLTSRVLVLREGLLSAVVRDRDAIGRAMLGTDVQS
jgi:ABC-type uncharacterized transport system ATPase subunit